MTLYDGSIKKVCLGMNQEPSFSVGSQVVSSFGGSHGFILVALIFQPGAVRE